MLSAKFSRARQNMPWWKCDCMTAAAWTPFRSSNSSDPTRARGNIATAVKAVKLGAGDYLLKPADADDIISALLAPRGGIAKAPSRPMSADRVRWEHIHRVYEVCGRNVSETARSLNMHRRTLQRILTRRAGLLERA
jgi:DNA-binding NtrC family response regulator